MAAPRQDDEVTSIASADDVISFWFDGEVDVRNPVSYTHLTLPTILLV